MTVPRAAIVVLALLVSPAMPAVCEVACALPVHAAHHATVAQASDHDHHGHLPQEAGSDSVRHRLKSGPSSALPGLGADGCDLLVTAPARPRGTSLDGVGAWVVDAAAALPPTLTRLPSIPTHDGAASHAPPHRPSTPLRL